MEEEKIKLEKEIDKETSHLNIHTKVILARLIYTDIYYKFYPELKGKTEDAKNIQAWKDYLKKNPSDEIGKSIIARNEEEENEEKELRKMKIYSLLMKYAELSNFKPKRNGGADSSKFLPSSFVRNILVPTSEIEKKFSEAMNEVEKEAEKEFPEGLEEALRKWKKKT